MTTPERSYGTNFRRAEEASNAQGMTQAALDWALKNAEKNPTPENIAIAKDTYAARQETLTAQGKSPTQVAAQVKEIVNNIPAQSAELDKIIAEAQSAIEGVNAAGADIPGFQPLSPIEINNKNDNRDAYALLEAVFKSYGLDSLVPVIRGYMQQDLGVEQAKLRLKTEPVYKERFKGNELRAAKGLNVLDEASYLELENDYSETLRAYGLSDYFGVAVDATSRLARQQKMAEVIGNDISAVEFKARISTATSRVQNADKNTKDAFKALYGIGDTELVKYFLDPTKGSEELKAKATAAEISGAAVSTGLAGTSLGTAEELAKLGVDKATALKGYSDIAEYLPRTEFLGQVYDETGIKYDRASAEAETFRGTASEKRKREQLKAMEEAQFGGSSGRLRTGRTSDNSGAF